MIVKIKEQLDAACVLGNSADVGTCKHQVAGSFLSGGDLEACEPIGQIGNANFRPLPPWGTWGAMG